MKKRIIFISLILPIISCNETISQKNQGSNKIKYDSIISAGSEAFEKANIDSAIYNFQQAIMLDDSKVIGYYRLGVAQAYLCNQQKTTECQKALENFKKVIDKKPDYERVNYNIGIIYFNKNSFENALYHFDKAIEKDSNDVDYFVNRGLTKLALKDSLGSCLDFRIADKLGDKDSQYFIELLCTTR